MTTFAGQYGPEPALDSNGVLLKSTSVPVYTVGTTTMDTLYTDRTMALTTPNPTGTDLRGTRQ